MEVLKKLCVIENTCVGLGFFDGVHQGHSALIKKLVELTKQNNSKSVVLTFQKSPAEAFSNNVTYITSNEEKEKLMSALGVDYMFELDFDEDLKNMSAEDYLEKIICSNFKPKFILTGFNHTFGRGKCGNPEFLKNNQDKYGYKYVEIPPVKCNDEVVSSTYIRSCIEKGDLKKANILLGHDFLITGIVQKGNQIGRTIGFPTANIEYPPNKPSIPFGVYRARVGISDRVYHGMLNYGIKPTINGGKNKPVVEVHILDFDEDIYNEKIDIYILEKIRNEKKFNSLEELKQQIKEDLKRC